MTWSQPQVKAALNADFTFDTFVTGDSNSFAYGAARAVAEAPGQKYNPFFIYGHSCSGKTHLMHAIGNHIIRGNADTKLVYATTEDFSEELVNALKIDKLDQFREKYCNVDVLMIDDIQLIAGKESTQHEFLYTFNALREMDKQVVIASDQSVSDLKYIMDTLRTRFVGGLTAEIGSSDHRS
jgi:chromosomal replication initiator protein